MKDKLETGIKVGDVMTREFVSISPDTPLLKAVELMVKKRKGSLILEEQGLLKGIITEKDIMWALTKKINLEGVKAGDIAIKKITTISPTRDIYDATQLMRKTKFRRLPVTQNKKVIGLLTLKDILKIQPELFEIAREGYAIKSQDNSDTQNEKPAAEGFCEECGNTGYLYNIDGALICESCKDSL